MHANQESVFFARIAVVGAGLSGTRLPGWHTGQRLAEQGLRHGQDGQSCSLPPAPGIRQELGTAARCLQCQLLAWLVNYLVNWPLKFPTACPLLHSEPAAELFTLFQQGRWISSELLVSCREEAGVDPARCCTHGLTHQPWCWPKLNPKGLWWGRVSPRSL